MRQDAFEFVVGMARFERAALWSQTRCATRLRHIPMGFPNEKPRNVEAAGILGKSGAKEEA